MAMQVTSAAAPRTLQRAKKRSTHKAGTPTPAQKPVAPKPAAKVGAADAAAGAAAATAPKPPVAGAAAPAAPAPSVPPVVERSPEYDSVDIASVIGDIAGNPYGGVTNDMVSPHVKAAIAQFLDPKQQDWLENPYLSPLPGKLSGMVTAEIGAAVGSVLTNSMRGVLHGKVKGVEEAKDGLGYKPTAPNKLIATLIKKMTTAGMETWLKQHFTPPPPPPAPVYPPDVAPLPQDPVPTPPPGKKLLDHDVKALQSDGTLWVMRTAIGAVYDQTVGPLVQRFANTITGSKDEIKKPTPLTVGKLVNTYFDTVLGGLFVRSLEYPKDPAGGTMPFAATLSTSILNNIIGSAWNTVYGRGLGSSIEKGVNQLAGVRDKEEAAKAKLPAMEHFLRASTRGVAVGVSTHFIGKALQHSMVKLGTQIGGIGGALVGMAGAALIGSVGAGVIDATIGPMLGKVGGQLYSWLSGKPAYEQRVQQPAPADPGPTPGDPVKAPNGNPGTVPAPAAPAAPPVAAPAAGAAKKRKKTGVAAIDKTSPAIAMGSGKLAKIALAG